MPKIINETIYEQNNLGAGTYTWTATDNCFVVYCLAIFLNASNTSVLIDDVCIAKVDDNANEIKGWFTGNVFVHKNQQVKMVCTQSTLKSWFKAYKVE